MPSATPVRFEFVLDPAEQSRRLVEVLELAEALPSKPRPLASTATAMTKLVERIVAVAASLEAAEIPWALGGALALAYATNEPRGTRDIDVNVFVGAVRCAGGVRCVAARRGLRR